MADENDQIDDDWASAMAEQGAGGSAEDDWSAALAEQAAPPSARKEAKVHRAELHDLEEDELGVHQEEVNLDMLLDIPVDISMEIGRTRISIRNLLQLTQGSVVELDRLAGEPLDVLVNGTLIAHGEVVVVNEKFGIRLTDVISASERVKRLR